MERTLPSREPEVLVRRLQTLGLTPSEARAYLAVVQLGSARTVELAREARLQRTEVYRLMSRLVTMGLVEETLDMPKRYQASNPQYAIPKFVGRAAKQLKEATRTANELIPTLNSLKRMTKLQRTSEVRVLHGTHNTQANFLEQLASARSELWMTTTEQQIMRTARSVIADVLRTLRLKRLSRVRLITDVSERDARLLEKYAHLVEIRHAEGVPVHLYGIDDQAVSISLARSRSREMVSEVLITHPEAVQIMRRFFEAFWEQSTPLNVWIAVKEQDRSTYPRRTVIWGREQLYKAVADWHLKARERILDYMPTENGPVRVSNYLRNSFTEARNRGIKMQSLCHISRTNLAAVKEMCKFTEVRHTEASPGIGLAVLDESEAIIQYIQSDTTDLACPTDITIYVTDRDAVHRLGEMFDLIWKNSIPAEIRIRELSGG